MFERRVKIFLAVLILFALFLVARAFQTQVLGRGYWRAEAEKAMTAPEFMETGRGSLLDRKGRPIASVPNGKPVGGTRSPTKIA